MTMLVYPKRRRGAALPEPDERPAGTPPEVLDATALYARSVENRRVMFLELVAWAIQQAEQAAARGEVTAFTSNLVWCRERDWKPHPWPGAAKDPERFARHVADLARGFTDDGGVYPLRREAQEPE
jgi:hypothetical protein